MILKQGAEAIIIKEDNNVIKRRIEKGYRIKEIDRKLRKYRTRSEAKILSKLSNVPKVYSINNFEIKMDFIDGDLLKDVFYKVDRKKICKEIGEFIRKMHDQGIIHGDITTSNIILKDNKLYFIDFGLGFFSDKIEDKAVDLHLLRQALNSKHYQYEDCFDWILKAYNDKEVENRLEKVEKRGRYKGKK